jgi:hypothetical protein
MKSEHKPGVHEQYLVKRRLKLEGFTHDDAVALVRDIDQLRGIDRVSIDEKTKMLSVAYDASTASIGQIEEVLTRHDCDLSHTWWNRFKERWYEVKDQNIKDIASRDPWTCHKI